MMVRGSVPSLIQGISQQVPTLRPPSYIDDGLNCYGTPIDGLSRRPATNHLAILEGLEDPAASHFIIRDDGEKYLAAVVDGELKVWDFEGEEKTVSAPDGWDYIADATKLKFLTINDYTFVYDLGKTVEMASDVEGGSVNEALFFVRQGDYATPYTISVGYPASSPSYSNGSYTTSSSSAADIKVDNVATQLASSLSSALGAGWTVTRYSHVISVKKDDNADFVVQATDGATGKNVVAIKGRLNRFSDLPPVGRNDFHIRIVGDEGNQKDDWYAKFVTSNPTAGTLGPGYWQESPGPGAHTTLDAATMPHVLVSNGDGTFTFREAEWGERVAGDDDNAPAPSFVDREITFMGASKQRLEIQAGTNTVHSRAADVFNFWPVSAQFVSDSDPIDVSPSHTKPFTLRGSAEFQKGIVLFANDVQFLLTAGDVFSPKTVAAKRMGTYSLQPETGLFGLQQDRVLCALNKGRHSGLLALRAPSSSLNEIVFDESSAVVPSLIPGETEWIAGSPTENVVVMKAEGSSKLFSYKESEDQGKIIQSAWQPWSFLDREAVNGAFDGADLYLLMKDAADVFTLERMSFSPVPDEQYLDWDIHLDRRTALEPEDFEASGATTTVQLPWTPSEDEQVFLVISTGPQAGAVVKAQSVTGDEAIFPGLYEGPGVVGVWARSWAKLSTLYWRKAALAGGEEAVVEAPIQLTRGIVSYDKSGPFIVKVKPHDRADTFEEKVALPLFEELYFLGPQNLRTGSTNFPIGAMNERVDITFDSGESPMPMKIASFEWLGDMQIPARPL